jgi:soluble lytic murein transglycosylase-like protein
MTTRPRKWQQSGAPRPAGGQLVGWPEKGFCYRIPARMLKRRESRTAAQTAYLKLFPLIALAGAVFTVPAGRVVTRGVAPVQSPPTPATFTPQGVQSRRTPKEIEALIRESARKHGLPEEQVVYIAWRESKFKPDARSKTGRYVGLYQFDLVTWRNTPEGRAGMRREDPVANINAAHWHMKTRGFQAWAIPGATLRRSRRTRGRTA